jgi:hypothetical protein
MFRRRATATRTAKATSGQKQDGKKNAEGAAPRSASKETSPEDEQDLALVTLGRPAMQIVKNPSTTSG